MNGVKFSPSAIIYPLACLAFLPGCKPQAPDMEKLSAIQQHNAELRQEISRMQALIFQAGEDTPGLQEQIDRRNNDVADDYRQMEALRARETELKMRRIELEGRLNQLRDSFRQLQNDLANQNHPS